MGILAGKTALVTGASKGIGAAIARDLASAGAHVAVHYSSSKSGADHVVKSIHDAGGQAFAIQADISDPASVKGLFTELSTRINALDILVNNAGVYEMGPIESLTADELQRQFGLNVFGLAITITEALGVLDRGSSIVNIGSSVTSFTPANSLVYTASKGAVDTITGTLSKELGPRGIRVNSVNPGLTVTDGMQSSAFSSREFRTEIENLTPLGRIGIPEDIAPAVTFLASDRASWITGEILVIGGGLS
ncbi:SDR family NAD(P)-dependent oxidoreductase [Mycobacteroides salmoniphilum]|uniref:3-oxoacyl-[acyl-carrier-protein] reductase FabG n=1 Tax=Mycobacteroides salmoniphilum TaxID=404941 RepID=A0A4R8STI8_9MYCO|nr:SDR family oxidoreductase [Mycobacteroides salmoniphilum]TEA03752.1 3-oxoacyl-[acyl-carrier-protein] reductase FabG [Mycobacteroides salmoniphilum]